MAGNKTMLVSLNMNGNEIQNFIVQVLATAPAAAAGKMYFNSTEHTLYYHNGTSWVDLSSVPNSFGEVKVGSDVIEADSGSDRIELVAGDNITLTADVTNDKITITAVDTTYDPATQSTDGLMSSTDKTKLDGIEAGAEVNVQSDWNQTTTTADDYIKNKPTLGAAAAKGVDTSIDSSSTDNDLATAKATYDFVTEALAASDALIFKGTIGAAADSPTITSLPTTYKVGWTYRVVTDGTYAGKVCEVGDLIIALVDRSGSGNLNSDWCVAQTNIDGAITNLISGTGIIITGSGSSRTIASELRRGNVTLTAGLTSVSASISNLVSYKAFDASTGEELIVTATVGASSVSFGIASAYSHDIVIEYIEYYSGGNLPVAP